MKQIPITDNTLVIRTDFSNEKIWKLICKLIKTPQTEDQFLPNVEFHSNKEYENIELKKILSLLPNEYEHSILFVIDKGSISNKEYPIVCIDLMDKPGNYFRVIPSEMWGVENNLSLGNMEFEEFANCVDEKNIFRGFQ